MFGEKNLAVQTFVEEKYFRRHHSINLKPTSQQKWYDLKHSTGTTKKNRHVDTVINLHLTAAIYRSHEGLSFQLFKVRTRHLLIKI